MTLRRKSPLRRRSSLPRSRPPRKANAERKATNFARAYGSKARVEWVKGRMCMAGLSRECEGPIENAHVTTGGAGRKSDAANVVPLCRRHHRDLHLIGLDAFERAYVTDLTCGARLTEQAWRETNTEVEQHGANDPAGPTPTTT